MTNLSEYTFKYVPDKWIDYHSPNDEMTFIGYRVSCSNDLDDPIGWVIAARVDLRPQTEITTLVCDAQDSRPDWHAHSLSVDQSQFVLSDFHYLTSSSNKASNSCKAIPILVASS